MTTSAVRNGRSFADFLKDTYPAPAPAETAAWRNSLAFRLTDGPDEVTIGFADDGLLHLHYSTAGGYRVRQVCTFRWFLERLLASGSPVAAGSS